MISDLRDAVLRLAQRDPDLRRFGASAHRYAFRAPLAPSRLEAIERDASTTLPTDYRRFLLEIGEGGAGPGHGVVPLDHPIQLASLAQRFTVEGALHVPRGADAEQKAFAEADARLDGTVILADHGCCYLSALVVDRASPAFGRVYADLRSGGAGLVPSHASFSDWYLAWLDGSLHEPSLLRSPVPASHCAPPNALEGYLANVEKKHGAAPAELTEDQVRAALLGIGDGGLANRTEASRCFDEGDAVRICLHCQSMIDRFVARGMMRPAQILAGRPAKMERPTAAS